MSKTVYTIHGSEDGIFAVVSNKKRAYEIACDYLIDSCMGYKVESYSTFIKNSKDRKCYTISTDNASVEIEMFILNNNPL